MHQSSLNKMKKFIKLYLADCSQQSLTVLDVGSQVIGAGRGYRNLFAPFKQWKYVGLDMQAGNNVDICVNNPYDWTEVETNSCDVVISGQAFEHVQFFWITFHEISRVLKDGGLACIIAPSTGPQHRYPFDCWRYYPDGLSALCQYVGFKQVEVFTDWGLAPWADSFLVMQKPRFSPSDRAQFMRKNLAQKWALTGDLDLVDDFMSFGFIPDIHDSVIPEKSNCDAAYAAFKESVKAAPICPALYLALSAEEIKRKHFVDAIETLSKAIQVFPNNQLLCVRLGDAQRKTADIDGAIASYKKAIDLDPSDFAAQKSLGDIYYEVYDQHPGVQKSDVISAYDRALAIKPREGIKHRLDELRKN